MNYAEISEALEWVGEQLPSSIKGSFKPSTATALPLNWVSTNSLQWDFNWSRNFSYSGMVVTR